MSEMFSPDVISAFLQVIMIDLVLAGDNAIVIGLAASFIARLLQKHRWIAYVGLLVILYVSLDMIWRGAHEVWPHVQAYTGAG